MKIGLRTFKTALAAVIAMLLAYQFQLLYAPSAGIIAILSVGNTKKNSLTTGVGRVLSLGVATALAFLCFNVLGFNPIAFGIYLLLFIPISVRFNLTDAIAVNSVLVTHYMLEGTFTLPLIMNEFLLMFLGVGLALLANTYMPNIKNRLVDEQSAIEENFRLILRQMAQELNHQQDTHLVARCDMLLSDLRHAQNSVLRYQENRWVGQDLYYEDYFLMRRSQARILADMADLVPEIQVEEAYVEELRQLLLFTAQSLTETNDGSEILAKIDSLYEDYREKDLPKTREEFEHRARLFQFLQSFKDFIELKAEFSKNLDE